ncbi:MAG: ABC transporter ATP-binding protein, partial [Oscillospiraceae bacterium]
STMGIFLSYFKPHRRLFLLDMCCAFCIALIDLAFPYVSRIAMNDLLPRSNYRVFFLLMGGVFLAFCLRAGLIYVVCYWGHTFGIRVEADIRQDLFRHMQELSFGYFDRNRTGQLMNRLTGDLFDITELAHHGPEDLFISAVTIVGALGLMFTIEWRLALVVALIVPIFLLVIWKRRASMSAASGRVKQRTAAINADIESGLSGMRTAKAFANEGAELEKFTRSNEDFKHSKRQFHREMGKFMAVMEFFLCILSVVVIAVGGYLIMRGELGYADLIAFSLYITAFITPIRKLANFAELFSSGFAGLQRFSDLMRTQPELLDAPDAKTLGQVTGTIDFDHVSFAYQEGEAVLEDINLHIQPGETIAVVGPSGGGKSTLCQLIPRFYDVSEGAVRLDGQDVRQVTQTSLHQNVGVVQQDVFLFADSVLENIRYGKPDATEEEVCQAARRAEIYDDICDMPDGFDTYVGERGALLSGGQKQRISIARIFLKNPPVLILDEATSALDSVTEAKIQKTFDALAVGRTTLVIAHRLSTVRDADRILVVRDGRIEEEGRHEDLMKQEGAYAALYRTQNLHG